MANSTNRALLFWAIGIIAALGLIWGLAKLGASSSANLTAVLTIDAQDHLEGVATAPAKLIEYSDFECPACAYYAPIVRAVKEKAGDKLVVVYRSFPLTSIHQYAQLAAQAAEAAALQDKFWEMHDILFARQNSWSKALDVKATMIDYARELKLDVTKFTVDIDSQAVKDRVARDVTNGNKINIQGTPTLYLNKKSINLPITEQSLLDLVNQAAPGSNS